MLELARILRIFIIKSVSVSVEKKPDGNRRKWYSRKIAVKMLFTENHDENGIRWKSRRKWYSLKITAKMLFAENHGENVIRWKSRRKCYSLEIMAKQDFVKKNYGEKWIYGENECH